MLGYGLTIEINLKNNKQLVFDGSCFQDAVYNFFEDWATVGVSPKQLAAASSVDEMILLLSENVYDGDRLIFKESQPMQSDVDGEEYDAYNFVKMIRENISDMNDIRSVSITVKEYNEYYFYRKYVYDKEDAKYTSVELGTPEGSEKFLNYSVEPGILYFSDVDECTVIEKKDVYEDADPDEAIYGFLGCVIKDI